MGDLHFSCKDNNEIPLTLTADKEATPTVPLEFHDTHWVTFYEDDMLPSLLKFIILWSKSAKN
jgi:hypothetical protein